MLVSSMKARELVEIGGFEDHYIRTVVENAGKPARPVKIVVDCGNAVPGL